MQLDGDRVVAALRTRGDTVAAKSLFFGLFLFVTALHFHERGR